MGPLKRPRIKYIGQLARWQILALIPLFFRFPIPQVCPPLEVTPLNEATDPDDMSMIEAVVFISVMLSENTLQQSWSWSFRFEENLFHQSLDCVQASLYSLISSPVRIRIVDSTIHHNHHLVLYFATTVIFNREDQNHHQFYNVLRACLGACVYNCRSWHHSYSTPSCHEWDFPAILAPVSPTSQVFHAIEEDKGVLVFTPVQVSAWCGGNYLESNFYQHAIFFGHCCFHVSPNLTFGEVVSLFGWCLWWWWQWWRWWRRRQWWRWWPCKESFSSQPHCAGNPEIKKSLLKIHLWNFCHD